MENLQQVAKSRVLPLFSGSYRALYDKLLQIELVFTTNSCHIEPVYRFEVLQQLLQQLQLQLQLQLTLNLKRERDRERESYQAGVARPYFLCLQFLIPIDRKYVNNL